MFDLAGFGFQPRGKILELFTTTQPGEDVRDDLRVHMDLSDVMADVFVGCVPEKIQLSRPQALTVPSVDQVYFQVPFPRKFDALCSVLDSRQVDRTMVFCATKRMVDELAERLPSRGYAVQAIHGDVTQTGRERALKGI